jgi:hypothetical protein
MIDGKNFSFNPADRVRELSALQAGLSLGIKQPNVVFNILIMRSFLAAINSSFSRATRTMLAMMPFMTPAFSEAAAALSQVFVEILWDG